VNKATYFTCKNCSVCKALLPKIDTHFAANYSELEFVVSNVENEPKLAADYQVFTIPVLIIQFEGKEHFRFVRNFSTQEIDEKLKRTYELMFG